MQNPKKSGRTQAAALPYRIDGKSASIMLVTSRETRRWVIPKGWVSKGEKPNEAARREAFEEAGLVGKVAKSAIGTYSYEKRLADGTTIPCEVAVFPLKVDGRKKKWPERGLRDGRWFEPEEAIEAVDEPELRELISKWATARAKRAVSPHLS